MYNNRFYKPGYAIAEVLLAMVIISISFLQLSQSLGNVMDAAKENIFVTRAINIANSTMEEVMAQPFDERGSEAGGNALKFNRDGNPVTLDNVYNGIKTISFWLQVKNIDQLRTDYIFDFDGVKYIKIFDSTLSSNVTAPTYYINAESGVTAIGAINTWYHVVITTNSGIDVSALKIGKLDGNDNGLSGIIDEVQFWSTVKDPKQIKNGVTNPYNSTDLRLYLRMNEGAGGSIAFDHSKYGKHCTITDPDNMWVDQSSSWSTTLGPEGEDSWSEYDDVDDFNSATAVPDDIYYDIVAEAGITKTITVVYVDINATTWAVTSPSGSPPTDYKEITVRVNIPGGDSYAQLKAIKSAKTIQNYTLTYSPYGN